MPSLNQVVFMGHLGSDPEVRHLQNENRVANVSIASSRNFKRDGEWEEETAWMKVVAWGYGADKLGNCSKGDCVLVTGRLQVRSWEDSSGTKRYSTEIVAGRVVAINTSGGIDDDSDDDSDLPPVARKQEPDDDDVPF